MSTSSPRIDPIPICPQCGFPSGYIGPGNDIIFLSECSCGRPKEFEHAWWRLFNSGVGKTVFISGTLHAVTSVKIENFSGDQGKIYWVLSADFRNIQPLRPLPDCKEVYELLEKVKQPEGVEINFRRCQIVSVTLDPQIQGDEQLGWKLNVKAIPVTS